MHSILKAIGFSFVLSLALSLFSGCTEKHDGQRLDFKADRESQLYSDSLEIYLYGQTRITRYPVAVGDRLTIDYKRDTIDFFLVKDPENGRIILPIVPDSVDLKIRMSDKLVTEGLPRGILLERWYALNHLDSVSDELSRLLSTQETGSLSALLTLASLQRFQNNQFFNSLAPGVLMRENEVMTTLGLTGDFFEPRETFVYSFGTPEKPKRLSAVMGKDTMMVVSVLDGKSVSTKDTAYLLALDSLAQQKYYILSGTDSLPTSWKKILGKNPKKNHASVDSAGMASRLVGDMNLSSLPTYMITDSLSRIVYRTENRDSLLKLLHQIRKK